MKISWNINIHKHISINIGILPIIILSLITEIFNFVILIFLVALIHETFHLIMAHKLGIEVKKIRIMPFGVAMQLSSDIRNPVYEILVAVVGPASNIMMFIIFTIINSYKIFDPIFTDYLIIVNLIMAFFNLIPVLPLDGGRIAKALFSLIVGEYKSYKVMFVISKIFIVILLFSGSYLLYYTKFNISLLLISIFLIFNFFKEKENSNYLFMKQITLNKEKFSKKSFMKTTSITALYNTPAYRIIDSFRYDRYCIVTVIDKDMNIIGTLTEGNIIEGMVRYGVNTELGEIVVTG